MSTRSSARRLLSPIEDPKRLLSRKNRSEPSLLFNLEEDDMAGQAPPQGPIPDLRSMEELLQAPTDGAGDAIVDSRNYAANGNFLTKNTQEALTVIENKSKVQTSRNKPQVVSASRSSTQDAHVTALTKQVDALLSSFNRAALHERPQYALSSNTEPNLREQVNSITTRSGLTTAEPSTPPPVTSNTQDKEKLEELANTLINVECSAILLNKVPEKLEDLGKFLIPCILQDLEVYNSLADSGASLNLMPLLIYEKLGGRPLKPTRITLELANHSVTFPMGIAKDVIVKVKFFNFLADFVIVDFEVDLRVPIILGRPFLRTAKALMDLYEEKLTLRVGNEKSYKPISGNTTFSSNSSPSSPLVETSDSILEEFADEPALFDPFLPRNEDDIFDPEADLKEIEYLLNRDPSTVSSPTTDIDIINPVLERFTDEPALVYSSPPGDDDDDLFYLKSDNDEWKKLLYGDSFNDTHSKNDKTKDSKTKSLIDEADIVESNVLPPQLLTSDSTLPESHLSLLFCYHLLSERNFLSISSDQELLFHLELTVIETLLSFSSKNEDKVFNLGILTSKGVHYFTLGLSYRAYENFKIINVHPNILNESPMKIFPFFCFCPKDKRIRGESS
ncbi:reverse transcriptase domain-containing protein [Tanacetum coccineum]